MVAGSLSASVLLGRLTVAVQTALAGAVWLVPAATETVIFAVPLALPVTVMVVPERLASAMAVLSTDTEIAPFPALVTAMVF